MPNSDKRFNFGLYLQAPRTHRTTPGNASRNAFDIHQIVHYARAIENSGYSLLILEDELDSSAVKSGAAAGLEAFTQAAYIASKTSWLGIAASANTQYTEPFSLARLFASLDHVSHGRAAWLVTDTESGNAARNHQVQPSSTQSRHARRDESIDVVNRLCDTWEDSAFIRDKASGRFIDTDKVHFLEHRGQHFAVKGPLNVARPPQGQVPRLRFVDIGNTDEIRADDYDVLISIGLEDSSPSVQYALSAAAPLPRHWKLVVPFVADDIAVAIDQAIAHVDSIELDSDIQGAHWTAAIAQPAAPTAAVGQRNLAALAHASGVNFDRLALEDVLDDSLVHDLNAYGKALHRIAAARRRWASPGETRPAVRLLDLLRAHADPREVFVGTGDAWDSKLRRLASADGPYHGILIAPGAGHYLDAEAASRLVPQHLRPATSTDTPPQRRQLRETLHLPRPENSFVNTKKSA